MRAAKKSKRSRVRMTRETVTQGAAKGRAGRIITHLLSSQLYSPHLLIEGNSSTQVIGQLCAEQIHKSSAVIRNKKILSSMVKLVCEHRLLIPPLSSVAYGHVPLLFLRDSGHRNNSTSWNQFALAFDLCTVSCRDELFELNHSMVQVHILVTSYSIELCHYSPLAQSDICFIIIVILQWLRDLVPVTRWQTGTRSSTKMKLAVGCMATAFSPARHARHESKVSFVHEIFCFCSLSDERARDSTQIMKTKELKRGRHKNQPVQGELCSPRPRDLDEPLCRVLNNMFPPCESDSLGGESRCRSVKTYSPNAEHSLERDRADQSAGNGPEEKQNTSNGPVFDSTRCSWFLILWNHPPSYS